MGLHTSLDTIPKQWRSDYTTYDRNHLAPEAHLRSTIINMNRQSPATNNPRLKPLLDRLHQKCTLPRANELGEDLACHICQEAFLASATSPKIPVKLPCNHLCGLSCILRWLAPLSSEPRDTCPYAESPYLVELLPRCVVCNMNLNG